MFTLTVTAEQKHLIFFCFIWYFTNNSITKEKKSSISKLTNDSFQRFKLTQTMQCKTKFSNIQFDNVTFSAFNQHQKPDESELDSGKKG